MLVGREEELASTGEVVDTVAGGSPASLLVVGDPGIGKTALLTAVARTAAGRGATVVVVTAVESESTLPGAVLELVLARLGLDADPAAGPQVLLRALVTAAARRPVLLVVDDVHWLDTETRRAVTFALRRLLVEPVGIVLAGRPEAASDPELSSLPTLRLGPLHETAAVELLLASRPGLGRESARRLAHRLGAVPLALVDDVLDVDAPGSPLLDGPAAVGRAVADRYAAGFRGLGEREQLATAVLAADDGTGSALLGAALAEAGAGIADLAAAESEGLVSLGARPRFVHPLARSAVWSSLPAAVRRRAHAAWAAAATGSDPGRALRHRAAAASAPDESIAVDLEAEAHRLARGGLLADAAALAETAVALSEDLAHRQERLVLVAETSPDPQRVVASIRQLLGEGAPPALVARCMVPAADSGQVVGDAVVDDVIAALDRGALSADELDAFDWVRLWTAIERVDLDGIRALVSLREQDESPGWWTLTALGIGRTWLGDCGRGVEHLRAADALVREVPVADLTGEQLIASGMIASILGLTDEHRARFAEQERRARASGVPSYVAGAAFLSAERARRDGAWARAESLYVECIELMSALGAPAHVERLRLGSLQVMRGDLADARGHLAAAAAARATRTAPAYNDVFLPYLRGLLALADGQVARAVDAFAEGAAAPYLGRGCRDAPALCAFELVETLAASGRTEPARAALAGIETRLDGSVDPLGLALLERSRALVDGDLARFESAHAWHEQGDDPFEAAHTSLLHGEALRRAGRPRDARALLERSLEGFARLQARPWEARAAAELRASGAPGTAPRHDEDDVALTPQELRVALAVCDGMTNAEAADALFLSVKTVEFHLSRTYRKVGVRSRTELRRELERRDLL